MFLQVVLSKLKIYSICKYIFCYSLITIVILIATESLISFGRTKQKYYKFERNINLREHPPNQLLRVRKTTDSKTNNLSTDSNGYINPSIINEKNSKNILFLGGSTTELKHVNEFMRFPYLVGRLLDLKIKNFNINAINSGVAGNNSMHSLNIFLNKGIWAPSKPDFVVFMHAINDLTTLIYNKSYYVIDKPRAIIITKNISSFDRRIITYQIKRFFPHLSERLIYLASKIKSNNKSQDEFHEYREKFIMVDKDAIKKTFKSTLNNFVESAKAWEINPILMTQANLFPSNIIDKDQINSFEILKHTNLNYLEFKKLYDDFNQIIRDVAIEKNIILIDLERSIPKETIYFDSNIHLNERGSSAVAKKISDVLIKEIIK